MSQKANTQENEGASVDVDISAFDNAQVFTPQQSSTPPSTTPPSTSVQGKPKPEEEEGDPKNRKPGNEGTPPESPKGDEGKDKPKPTYDTEVNRTKFKSYLNNLNKEELTDNQKAIKDSLLEGVEEGTINENGDVVDKDGKVIKTFDEAFKSFIATDTRKLDEKGNQIDEEGNIVKTKAELAAEDDNDVLNKAHQELGYAFQTEDGETKVYPNDTQGAVDFAKDFAKESNRKMLDSLYKKHPMLPDLLNHLELGGTFEDYNVLPDYSKIDKTTLSVEEKLNTIKKSLEIRGLAKERIENTLQLVKDGNLVDKEYDFAVSDIEAYNKEVATARQNQIKIKEQQEIQQVEKHWNDIKDRIDNDKVNYVKIPEAEKEAFFNYLSSPVDDEGNSQQMIDASKESKENQLGIAYLRYKGFDFGKLLKTKERESKVEKLKKVLAQELKFDADTSEGVGGDQSAQQPDVDISTMLG